MDFDERMALRPVLWAVMHERVGNSFEDFFHDVMTLHDPSFVDVRTHGKLGDQGSDGLSLHGDKLYACYAPEAPNSTATINKIDGDLSSALRQRRGQFSTFVFVHNDTRGVHPELATKLAQLRTAHPGLSIELMGLRHIRDILGRCEASDVEQVLGRQLPLQHLVGVGLEEMTELLGVLSRLRPDDYSPSTPKPVSINKLAYSELSPETQAELRDGMKHSDTIETYYAERIDVTERDDVAAAFNREYQESTNQEPDPEQVLLNLRTFLSGARAAPAPMYRAQTAILAFFFQTCDIFEDPPSNWTPSALAVAS